MMIRNPFQMFLVFLVAFSSFSGGVASMSAVCAKELVLREETIIKDELFGAVIHPQLHRRSADRPERAEVHGAVDRGRSDHRRLSASHAPAAGPLPVCPAANHSSSPLTRSGVARVCETCPAAQCSRRAASDQISKAQPFDEYCL